MVRSSVSLPADRDAVLDCHCADNYASEPDWARPGDYDAYRAKWLSSPQPEQIIASLSDPPADRRTLAELWREPSGSLVGFLWVTFIDVDGYDVTAAEMGDLYVASGYRRRGVATAMLAAAEARARQHGAAVLRSEVGAANQPSRRLHAGAGFAPYASRLEKPLG